MGLWLRVSGRNKNINFDIFLRLLAEFGLAGLVGQVSGPPGSVVISVVSNSRQLFLNGYFRFIFGVLTSPFWGPRAPNASILEPFWGSGDVPARLGRPVEARGGSD